MSQNFIENVLCGFLKYAICEKQWMIHNKTKVSSILPYKLIREMDSIDASSRANMDVREDEEQEIKCREVMELFLAAGYFRARIKV